MRYLAHAQADLRRSSVIPQIAAEFDERVRPRRRAAWCAATAAEDAETIVVALGSVIGTIEDVVDELRDDGVTDRRARHPVVPAVPARGGARGAAGTPRVVVLEKASRSASAASSRPTCACASLSGIAAARLHGRRRPRRARDHARLAASAARRRRSTTSSSRCTFLDLDWRHRQRELEREAQSAAQPARSPRTCCATSARSPRASVALMEPAAVKFYQTGTFTVGNRLLAPEQRTVQADDASAPTRSTPGHRACQGCGEALGRALRHRRGDARDRQPA